MKTLKTLTLLLILSPFFAQAQEKTGFEISNLEAFQKEALKIDNIFPLFQKYVRLHLNKEAQKTLAQSELSVLAILLDTEKSWPSEDSWPSEKMWPSQNSLKKYNWTIPKPESIFDLNTDEKSVGSSDGNGIFLPLAGTISKALSTEKGVQEVYFPEGIVVSEYLKITEGIDPRIMLLNEAPYPLQLQEIKIPKGKRYMLLFVGSSQGGGFFNKSSPTMLVFF